MQLRDIHDMEEYLENRCYCPYEVYDITGFFYMLFKPEAECFLIGEKYDDSEGLYMMFVVSSPTEGDPQILLIFHNGENVSDCVRIDATENNVRQSTYYVKGKIEKIDIDEYVDGGSKKELEDMLSFVDAIII